MSKKNSKRKQRQAKRCSHYLSEGKCFFCGSRNSLQKHHIIQKRFGGRDTKDNLIMVCPVCHRKYHQLTDILLNYLLKENKIHLHEIRESEPRPIIKTEVKEIDYNIKNKPEDYKEAEGKIIIYADSVNINS